MAKKLTAKLVQNLKADPAKTQVYGDEHGLRLYVRTGGSKQWQWRGTIYGVRRDLGLGSYPYVSLAEARELAFQYRKIARAGGDPRDLRKGFGIPTFEDAAEIVIALHEPNWKDGAKSAAQWRASLRDYAFPRLGRMPVDRIGPQDVMKALLPNWNDKRETMRRVKQRIQAVMKWSIAEGHRQDDPVAAIEAALPKNGVHRQHHTALPWDAVSDALNKVRQSRAWMPTKLAFAFLVHTAARSGEVRGATWAEIDTEARTWTIPGERMKAGRDHRVPLSDAAMLILNEAKQYRHKSDLIFPGSTGKAMSDSTMSKLLRENGIKAVPHGFRSSFRQWCADTGEDRELAEQALAHTVRGVEGAYQRSDIIERRRELMERWAGVVV